MKIDVTTLDYLFVIDNSTLLELSSLEAIYLNLKVEKYTGIEHIWSNLTEKMPIAIITEAVFNGYNGFEFCKKLKNNFLFRNIPIIFYSATDTIDQKEMAFTAGADDYWVKPLSVKELLLRLKVHVQRAKNQKQFIANLLKNHKLNSLDDAMHTGEASMRLILDYTFSWEVFTDTADKVVYSSPYFETLTGYKNSDFMIQKIGLINLVEPADYEKLIIQIKRCKQTLIPFYSHEFRIVAQSKEKKYLEISMTPVLNDDKQCIGYRYSAKDITERKIAELLLNTTQEELVEIKEDLEHIVETRTYDLKQLNKQLIENRNLLNAFLDYSSAWEVYRDVSGKIIFYK